MGQPWYTKGYYVEVLSMKMTVITVAAESLRSLKEWAQDFSASYPEHDFILRSYFVSNEHLDINMESMLQDVRTADLALIDLMGCAEDLINLVGSALDDCKGNILVIGYGCRDKARLGKFSMGGGMRSKKDPGPNGHGAIGIMSKMRRMTSHISKILPLHIFKDMQNVFTIGDYWQSGLPQDIASMMDLLLRNYYGWKDLPHPGPVHMNNGIFICDPHDRTVFASEEDYWKVYPDDPSKPSVAFLFYAHTYPNNLFPAILQAMDAFSPIANILPIGFSNQLDKDMDELRTILTGSNIRLIVNFMSFRLGAGPMGGNAQAGIDLLQDLDVPYLKPFFISKQSVAQYMESPKGASPGDFLISMMLPELDGGIDTYPIAAVDTNDYTRLIPLEGRIERLTGQAKCLLALQNKNNSEKKIAIICYDYPPGEENLFHAAFLDALASLSNIFQVLKDNGYTVDPMTPEEIENTFLSGKRGVVRGNVFLGIQPYRSPEHYHDTELPPDDNYIDFYRYLREEFQADAFLHVGTHGTLEFMPGKENGLTSSCWPDRLIGDIPNFYFYYCGNASEGMTAKRRSYAALLTYAAPNFVQSGLYGDLADLDDTLAEYTEAKQQAPDRAESVWKTVCEKASTLGLPTEEQALERELYRSKTSLIPDGLHVIGNDHPEELQGLIHALNGGYVSAGPMGDVHKEPDIYPTGRNGYAFDPRFVPSESAYARGQDIAKAAMQRYFQEYGSYPRHTAMVLWGLETAKTHGESIGQLMYYLGLRMTWKGTSSLSRIEVIPTEEMDRPRVDVTVTICGFFRDLFPQLLRDLNRALRELDELHETPEQSAFAERTFKLKQELLQSGVSPEQAETLARSRFFGPKDGEYGTSMTDVVKAGDWQDESELGSLFTAELGYVYGENLEGEYIPGLITRQLSDVEMISQVRSDADYEITDLDHYYEFAGGLQRAAKMSGSSNVESLILDTTGEQVYADTYAESAARGVRTRILNPKWIDGQLAHPFHGGQQIADRMENLLGLAATADCIPSETFSQVEKAYVSDPEMRRRMQDNNRYAYLSSMERLMEADRRGYWDATPEQREELRDVYLETEGEIEDAN